jgi:hypothetical protein
MIEELVIKVPAPFSGVEDVGFSARYPAQEAGERLRDIPVFVEGGARHMRVLVERLELFAEKERLLPPSTEDELYTWTSPIQLTDEVCVLAFRDRSDSLAQADSAALRSYLWNLVRPMAFTFLRDCVRIGRLRLADRIALVLDPGHAPTIDLEVPRTAISVENGTLLLA